ncbi:hypothetical protein [Escherichia coli]|uniref:hypothetical protein n=1 Tax=Escherichia coli TaxID=562 RepID=UPI003F5CCAC8
MLAPTPTGFHLSWMWHGPLGREIPLWALIVEVARDDAGFLSTGQQYNVIVCGHNEWYLFREEVKKGAGVGRCHRLILEDSG